MSNPLLFDTDPSPAFDVVKKRVKANNPFQKHVVIQADSTRDPKYITTIEDLCENTHVTTVQVNISTLTGETVRLFAELLGIHCSITRVDVMQKRGQEKPTSILLQHLCDEPNSLVECFSFNSLTKSNAIHLQKLLWKKHKVLHKLCLGGDLDEETFSVVVNAVQLSNVRWLDLSKMIRIRPECARHLVPLIHSNRLEMIGLSLPMVQDGTVLQLLLAALKDNASITRAHFLYNALKPSAATGLEKALDAMGLLEHVEINVSIGQLDASSRKIVAQALNHIETLHSFALTDLNGTLGDWLQLLRPTLRRARQAELRMDQLKGIDSSEAVAEAFQGNDVLQKMTLAGQAPVIPNLWLMDDLDSPMALLFNSLPSMLNLKHLDLSCVHSREWQEESCILRDAIKASPGIEEVTLPRVQQDESVNKIWEEIYFICKLRQVQKGQPLEDVPPSLWPFIISNLCKGKWYSVAFHALRAKPIVLVGASKNGRDSTDARVHVSESGASNDRSLEVTYTDDYSTQSVGSTVRIDFSDVWNTHTNQLSSGETTDLVAVNSHAQSNDEQDLVAAVVDDFHEQPSDEGDLVAAIVDLHEQPSEVLSTVTDQQSTATDEERPNACMVEAAVDYLSFTKLWQKDPDNSAVQSLDADQHSVEKREDDNAVDNTAPNVQLTVTNSSNVWSGTEKISFEKSSEVVSVTNETAHIHPTDANDSSVQRDTSQHFTEKSPDLVVVSPKTKTSEERCQADINEHHPVMGPSAAAVNFAAKFCAQRNMRQGDSEKAVKDFSPKPNYTNERLDVPGVARPNPRYTDSHNSDVWQPDPHQHPAKDRANVEVVDFSPKRKVWYTDNSNEQPTMDHFVEVGSRCESKTSNDEIEKLKGISDACEKVLRITENYSTDESLEQVLSTDSRSTKSRAGDGTNHYRLGVVGQHRKKPDLHIITDQYSINESRTAGTGYRVGLVAESDEKPLDPVLRQRSPENGGAVLDTDTRVEMSDGRVATERYQWTENQAKLEARDMSNPGINSGRKYHSGQTSCTDADSESSDVRVVVNRHASKERGLRARYQNPPSRVRHRSRWSNRVSYSSEPDSIETGGMSELNSDDSQGFYYDRRRDNERLAYERKRGDQRFGANYRSAGTGRPHVVEDIRKHVVKGVQPASSEESHDLIDNLFRWFGRS